MKSELKRLAIQKGDIVLSDVDKKLAEIRDDEREGCYTDRLEAVVHAFEAAGYGNSTDFRLQGFAYDLVRKLKEVKQNESNRRRY